MGIKHVERIGGTTLINEGLETRCQFTARVSFLSRKGSGSSRMGLVKGGGGLRATASLLIGSCLSPCFLSLRITIITPLPLAIRILFRFGFPLFPSHNNF